MNVKKLRGTQYKYVLEAKLIFIVIKKVDQCEELIEHLEIDSQKFPTSIADPEATKDHEEKLA